MLYKAHLETDLTELTENASSLKKCLGMLLVSLENRGCALTKVHHISTSSASGFLCLDFFCQQQREKADAPKCMYVNVRSI